MRIGLLSDTHGYLDEHIFGLFEECDELWHAGDIGDLALLRRLEAFKPTLAVYGNIDGRELRYACPEEQIFTRAGKKIWMIHIGGYPGRYPAAIRRRLDELKPDLFICGHSHILRVMPDPKRPPLLCMNPGAAGRQGFHRVRTLLRFTLSPAGVRDLEVIELGKR